MAFFPNIQPVSLWWSRKGNVTWLYPRVGDGDRGGAAEWEEDVGALCLTQGALERVPGIPWPSHPISSGSANVPGVTGAMAQTDGGGTCLRSQPHSRAAPSRNCAPCWSSAPLPPLGSAPGLWQRGGPHPGLSLSLLSAPGAQLSPQGSRGPRVLCPVQLQLLKVVQEPQGAPGTLAEPGHGGMEMFPLSLHKRGKGQVSPGWGLQADPSHSWLLLAWRSAMDTWGSSRWQDTHPVT